MAHFPCVFHILLGRWHWSPETDRIDLAIVHHDDTICILNRNQLLMMILVVSLALDKIIDGSKLLKSGIDRRSRSSKIKIGFLEGHARYETLALTTRTLDPHAQSGVIALFEILNKFIGLGNLTSTMISSVASLFACIFSLIVPESKDIGLKTIHLLTKESKIVFFDTTVTDQTHDIIETRNPTAPT